MIYTVWIVSPPRYIHSRAFEEVAVSLRDALIELGHTCAIVTSSFECRGRTIILGAHLLANSGLLPIDLPMDMVIWNLEQIFDDSPWLTSGYLDLLKGRYDGSNLTISRDITIWDYCQSNIDALSKHGITAKLLPVGYVPALTQIENVANPDIDVLFFGSMNDRRARVLSGLKAAGFNVVAAFNSYGIKRDALIARAKIVLNIHFYPSKTFEIVRCSYLLANRKCIVSEAGNDLALEEPFYKCVAFAEYDRLVEKCKMFLSNPEMAGLLGDAGYNRFSTMRQSDYLKGVL